MKKVQAGVLQAICQNIPDGICMIDMNWNITSWNTGAEIMLGYREDELIGKSVAAIIPEKIAQKESDHCISELNAKGKMSAYQTVRVAKDGRIVPIELTAVLLKSGRHVAGYAAIMRDITERKRMEQQIVESEASLRTIFDSSDDAIFVHDVSSGRILEVNEKFYELYGYRPQALTGIDVQSLSAGTTGYTNEDALRLIKKAAEGEPQFFEWMAKSRSGRLFPVEVRLRRVVLNGKDRILATVRDITERKRTEEALKLTQFSVDHASVCAFLVGRDARFLYVNEQTCRTLGYTREELLAMTVHDIDPDFPASVWDDHWNELKRQGSLHFETQHRRKDGTLVPVELSLNYVSFAGREFNVAFGVVITERKQAERKLRDSEERYRSIVETSTEWIWETDNAGSMTFSNPSVERMLGYLPADMLGKNTFDFILEEDRAAAVSVVQEAVQQNRGWKKCLLRRKHKDGSIRFIESNSTPVFDEAGNLTGFRGSDHDLTELKNSENALKRSYEELEIKVRERTRELARKNEELQVEITERQRAVELIRKSHILSDALNDLNTVIHSTLDFEEIMKRVVREAAQAIKVDGSAIGLIQDATFQIRYVHNMAAHLAGWSVPLDELPGVRAAAANGETIAFNDAVNDERLNRVFVREWAFQSMLISPLMIRKRMTGAIVFYSFANPFVFQREHIDFARKLAASVSLALENAELYRALDESRSLSETRLRELQTIYETAPVGLCFIDRSMRYVSINRRLAEINGRSIQETVGRTLREIISDEAAARTIEDLCRKTIAAGNPVENVEVLRNAETGLTVLSNFYPVRDQAGDVVGLNIVVQDITKRKRTEEALRTSERLLKALLNSIPDMAWLKDKEGRFILVNEPFGKACGKAPDELTGKTDLEAWPRELAEKYRSDDAEVMESRLPKRVEEPLAPPEGSVRWIETIKTPIYNEKGVVIGTAGIARDTTERKRMEEEIRHMALHDPLTGLPNRRLFLDILNLEIAQARRHKSKLAILFLDLDRFKEINDTLGHDLGDRLLRHVAGRFRSTIRVSDTVARIGGDEFNMVLSDIARPDDVSDIAVKIVNSLARPILLKGHELHISTSIGISIYPDDSEDVQTLLRYSDIAMYHAKEHGRNTYRFYNPSINITSLERMKLESYLRQAIKREELSLLYQPQIDIKSKKIRYAEALVRWRHPQRGVLDPKEFIPLAEETGFITAIDEWVLRAVCRQAKSWKDSGLNFCVTVNISARQFQSPGLVTMIAAVLRETGMPPDCLDLELTESTAMSNVERSAAQLRELRDMGIHISIDDFGTGYSSLNYLKKLPIERLKIDKSFVQDIARDADDRAIISAVTSMARKMGIRTVAEGVETEEQLEFLRASDCDEAQGFLFSKPLPAEEFGEFVAAGNR